LPHSPMWCNVVKCILRVLSARTKVRKVSPQYGRRSVFPPIFTKLWKPSPNRRRFPSPGWSGRRRKATLPTNGRYSVEQEGSRRVDSLSVAERSEIMARVRSKNSRPELFVRKLVFALGYRYRLHAKNLPGHPDLVFRRLRKVIFVHGCFWHRHSSCALARLPKSRPEFWVPKLEGNRKRDEKNRRALAKEGWTVLTIWECQLKSSQRLAARLRRFLDA